MKIEQNVQKYYELKQQIAALEAEAKKHKKIIEENVKEGESVIIGDFSVLISPVTRENFSLTEARATLAMPQFQSWIAPFISTTEFNQLRVKVAKEDAA
jgi:predicted phage-related endonuclease